MADEIIARLKFPMRVDGMTNLTRALEQMYPGEQVIITDPAQGAADGWLTIARYLPEPHDPGSTADSPT